jgi:hypothetical protein
LRAWRLDLPGDGIVRPPGLTIFFLHRIAAARPARLSRHRHRT